MADIVDINISQTVETVDIIVTPNLVTVNINQVTGGGSGDTNLGYTPSATNGIVTSDTGTDATIPLADNTNAGLLTPAEKTKIANSVPYTGATANVDLGEFGIQLGNLEFDNTPTNIPTTAGSLYYNNLDGTLDLVLKGGNVKLQIGQESVVRVVNKTATNITLLESNYQAVRVTGAQGQRLKVDLAQATNDVLSAKTIGLVTETILNNQEGFITTSGLVRNINTSGSLQGETWADGDVLYLSPTIAGHITKVKPTAPNHLIIIGYVIYSHATQGTIFVKVDNGYELDELHNVNINNSLNNQALIYESSTDLWKNKTLLVGDEEFAMDSNTFTSTLIQSLFTQVYNTIGTRLSLTNQAYTGNIVWTGGSAPIGTTEHTYSLSQVGNLVTLIVNLSYGTAGAGTLTSVAFELPSTAPSPTLPTSVTSVGHVISYGSGTMTATKQIQSTLLSFCALRIKSTGVYEIAITRSAGTYINAYATIQYFV